MNVRKFLFFQISDKLFSPGVNQSSGALAPSPTSSLKNVSVCSLGVNMHSKGIYI